MSIWSSVIQGLNAPLDDDDASLSDSDDDAAHREPWSTEGCVETFINPKAARCRTPAEAIANGSSVLLLEACATDVSCASLRAAASAAARAPEHEAELATGKVRLPTRRLAVAGAADGLFRDVLARLRKAVPALLPALFPGGLGDVVFTSNEPAINVYARGGMFQPHEDGMKLTVLVPLTDGRHASCGGTAFWASNRDRGAPAAALAPPAGSALVFSGDVRHAALRVEDGERVVFVASFSPRAVS